VRIGENPLNIHSRVSDPLITVPDVPFYAPFEQQSKAGVEVGRQPLPLGFGSQDGREDV
jgi:hypothetical protein